MIDVQSEVQTCLDSHLTPMLKDEWRESLSIYNIGATLSGDKSRVEEIIVWLRSYDILNHLQALLLHAAIDPSPRTIQEPGKPRRHGETVLVRLVKPIDNKELLIELFEVFESEEDAVAAFEALNKLTACNPS